MSYIGKNIRKIRAVKKMSQTDFANIFDISRTSVGAYEDERAEPKIETIIQIANHFELSIDTLLTKELTVNELFKFNLFKEQYNKEDVTIRQVDKDDVLTQTPLVTLDQGLDYIVNYHNQDFVNKLPVIHFPFTKTRKSRAFQIEGAEMEYQNTGLHHKDILLCKPVNDLMKLSAQIVYVFVTPKEILVRRFVEHKQNKLILKPDNPTYDQVELNKKEILEAWEATSIFSATLKIPTMLEERVAHLEGAFAKLQEQLIKAK